ncbi:CDP-glucose 4,6-dehydratase [Thalassobaculum salexigens]|uniref:CDP-glucose 4,6-dehydratase n=1 Tax=Thalassobaculum salexigens TaxID=455360 RepID=UPI000490B670|nr:CDP-glucose 4,6-dehydratase [Thalassobaculum salexigens]
MPTDLSKFWQGKRVLVTGHTGFKGAWLVLLLRHLGAMPIGVSLAPEGDENLFTSAAIADVSDSHFLDIRDTAGLVAVGQAAEPEIILHLAARSLVSEGYRDPVESFSTNVIGTVSVLEAVRSIPSVRSVVVATTDKVYRNNEWSFPYRETDALGGKDPYSASKAAAELATYSYAQSFLAGEGVTVCTVRAGNVIGGGDWAADRLVPDAVRSWSRNQDLVIRNPKATRPWQHVLEPLAGYLSVARRGYEGTLEDSCLNFGPNTHEALPVDEFLEIARTAFQSSAGVVVQSRDHWPESKRLALDISRARDAVGFEPKWTTTVAITKTMSWYRRFYEGQPAAALCQEDIEAFGHWEA